MVSWELLFRTWCVFISIAVIVWYVFKDLTTLKTGGILLHIASFGVYNIYAVASHYYLKSNQIDFLNTVFWLIWVIFVIKKNCNIKLGELIFVFFIIVNYEDAVYLFYKVSDHLLPTLVSQNDLIIARLIFSIFINVICLPVLIWIIKKIAKPIIMENNRLPIGTYLWLIPVCLFLIYRFCLWPTVDMMQYDNHLFSSFSVPFIWFIAVMLAHVGLFITVQRTLDGKALEEKYNALDRQYQLQQEQYYLIEEQYNEAARLRHDSRHHVLTVKEYLVLQEYAKAETYLGTLLDEIQTESIHLCDNIVVEAIAKHYLKETKKLDIEMTASLKIPTQITINEQDLIAILGNLLENAFEACYRQKNKERFIHLKVALSGNHTILISVSNSYEGEIEEQNGRILSSKRQQQEGIGLSSVQKIVSKYQGVTKITHVDHIFTVQILLNK